MDGERQRGILVITAPAMADLLPEATAHRTHFAFPPIKTLSPDKTAHFLKGRRRHGEKLSGQKGIWQRAGNINEDFR